MKKLTKPQKRFLARILIGKDTKLYSTYASPIRDILNVGEYTREQSIRLNRFIEKEYHLKPRENWV